MKNSCFEWCLEGLTGNTREIVEKYLDLINDIKENNNDDKLLTLTAPVVRYIVQSILEKEYQPHIIKDNFRGITAEKVIKLFDVNELMELLKEYCINFLPIGEKYLSDLDSEAELIKLFCENYIFKLISKINYEKGIET